MRFARITNVVFVALLLGLGAASAEPCHISGPRYNLKSDTVEWSMDIERSHSCVRGLRFANVAFQILKLVSKPQSGQIALQGPGFTYWANADRGGGKDSFTIVVAGQIRKKSGSSTIHVTVTVTDPPEKLELPATGVQPTELPALSQAPEPFKAPSDWGRENAIPTQIFELRDWFGVNHPKQIVEFTLNQVAAGSGTLLDERDASVPFQLLEHGNKLAILSDLPAHSKRTWRWFSADRPDAPTPLLVTVDGGVQIKTTEKGWEINNEYTAFLVPNAEAIKASAQSGSLKPLLDLFDTGPDVPRVTALAAIQGVRLRDGTWSAIGPNVLIAHAMFLTDAKVELVESGAFKSVVQIHYDFSKPAYSYGQQRISDPGLGYLNITLTLYAGQPSILIEEETDLDEVWGVNFYDGLEANRAQYKGHHSSNPELGHMPDGSIYLPDHERTHYRGEPDALVDLQFQRPQVPSYVSSKGSWRLMAVWDPWIFDGGWYWQLYNSSAGPTGNLVSIFAGPVSRALSPSTMTGAGIFTLPSDPRSPGKRVAGISSQSHRRSADAQVHARSRFVWGIFVGVKGQDLMVPGRVPTVNLQSNLFGGAINLTKLASMKFDFADPPQGYGGVYLPKAAVNAVIQRADPSGAKMRAAGEEIMQLARALVDDLANGQGIYTFRFQYWQGGAEMMRRGLWIDQVLASDKVSAEEKARVKAAAALFAYVLWDNDFVPMDNRMGFNLGTANMPQQQQGNRYFYALLLANHPDFVPRAALVQNNVLIQVRQQINEDGAHFGAPHYIGAAFTPTLNTLMQIKQLGEADPFRNEPRLAKFAEFFLNLLTPPEVRFPGRPRSYIALGDSSTETSPLYGQLGTAFRDADPILSRRLMGAWRAAGKPHSGFSGTTVMSIDDGLPGQDPALGSAMFPGYYSVLRSGWNTQNETAAWIVNGDFYRDHRSNDAGNLVLYALGVPLSVHWGSIYYPRTPSAYYHSSVVPESAIGRPWDAPSPPTNAAEERIWQESSEIAFSIGATVDTSVSKFSTLGMEWTRTLRLYHADPSMPVIVLRDEFAGRDASVPKVLTLNLLAKGAVYTPAGSVIPELRTHPPAERASNLDQLPSAGPVFPLPEGVSRLSFTGQFGVDFDVFVVDHELQEALLGNWADTWTQQSTPNWQERQHILRIRGRGPFILVLVPYRAGHRPSDLKVEAASSGVTLTAKGNALELLR